MTLRRNILILALFLISIPALMAQNGTMTPYSRYGYGILSDHATSMQRQMGGVGYAMNSGRQINVMNPASYAAIDSLTFLFDMGIDLTSLWSSEEQAGTTARNQDFGGGLDYVTMQFPLGKYMGASIGLVPYSSVGYSFGSDIDNGASLRQGSGSINEFYLGVAGRPFRGLTVGANVSYLFGTILNDSYAVISSAQSALFEKQLIVRDYHLNFGVQYSHSIAPGRVLTAGLTYSPAKTLLGTACTYYYDVLLDSKPEITDEYSLHHNFTLPETWGAGLNYRMNNNLMVEFDFTYQPWSKAKFRATSEDPVVTGVFADRTKYAIGGQYAINPRGNYAQRIQFRLGGYYSNDYLVVKDNRLREHGVSIGCGLPVPGFKTVVNLGLEWKHRQGHPQALIKEDYLNITLGINFNESWFRKSKIY